MASARDAKRSDAWQDIRDHATAAYGTNSHVTFAAAREMDDREVIQDYDPDKLSSFRVFCACKGTILQDPVLFIEQCLITIIFLGLALPVFIFFRDDMAANRHGAMDVNDWIRKQEPLMRQFAAIMMVLAAFLLSFYTSTSVARWWTMRTGGIGGIKAATMDLEMFICQFVTTEERVLSKIRSYSRASLTLVFLWRRSKDHKIDPDNIREQLKGRGLLEDHELDMLLKCGACLHETIWAWQTGIVTMLHKEGKIKSDQLLSLLLQRCSDGRAAVQLLHTHTAVRIPMQYVHLLGLLVKMHNFVLAVIMGILFGAALRNLETVVCLQLFGRTLILPFLFNAIMLINAELSDPFNNTTADFPGTVYQKGLEADGKGFCEASKNLPNWLATRYRAPA